MRHKIASDTASPMRALWRELARIAEIDARSTQIATFARAWGVWGYKLLEVIDRYPLAPARTRFERFSRILD
jgi:hypothetical protein